jgi:membrane-associated protease RseP (regulator of RpoE activity)
MLIILYTILGLIIIIGLHELAHLFACKAVGCGVEKFSIGFGKPIYSIKIGKTIYQFCWLLLGGYCAVKGELNKSRSNDAFYNLPYRKKAIILLAGVSINIITGILTAYLGYKYYSLFWYMFGINSIGLGIMNILPLAPCLDGGYLVFLPFCLKRWGKQKGYEIFARWVKKSLKFLQIINIISIPLAVYVLLNLK